MTSRDASKGQSNPKGITDPPERQLRLSSHEVKWVPVTSFCIINTKCNISVHDGSMSNSSYRAWTFKSHPLCFRLHYIIWHILNIAPFSKSSVTGEKLNVQGHQAIFKGNPNIQSHVVSLVSCWPEKVQLKVKSKNYTKKCEKALSRGGETVRGDIMSARSVLIILRSSTDSWVLFLLVFYPFLAVRDLIWLCYKYMCWYFTLFLQNGVCSPLYCIPVRFMKLMIMKLVVWIIY